MRETFFTKLQTQHICNLKGRDRNKNAEKTKFTNMLLQDAKFEDTYWQDDTIDSYAHTHEAVVCGSSGVRWTRSMVEEQRGIRQFLMPLQQAATSHAKSRERTPRGSLSPWKRCAL